jgi:hypothetical protein
MKGFPMKTTLILLLALVFILPDGAFAANKNRKYAYVVVPFTHIYRERQPESEIVGSASRGDKFVVKRTGEYWVEVYVPPKNATTSKTETGWLELGMETPKVEIREESDVTPQTRSTLFYGAITILIVVGIFLLVRLFIHARHKRVLDSLGHIPKH